MVVHPAHQVVGRSLDDGVVTDARSWVGADAGRGDVVGGRQVETTGGGRVQDRIHDRGVGGDERPG